MKRMKHPEHGWHHAYTVAEEERMRLHGWIDENEDYESDAAITEAPPEPPKRGPGRPRKVA